MNSSSAGLSTAQRLARLKTILQEVVDTKEFERLVAALISELLDVGVAVANSGFQHGGDGGPAGRQGRRFRIETKRYSDTTALSNRELLGEVDNALSRDHALEGWFLAATRDAPEQLENELHEKAEKDGIPIVVIDWKADSFPALAALCTYAPETVRAFANDEAAVLSEQLRADAQTALASLKRDMQAWQLGFESLREASHKHLEQLWHEPRAARGLFGQDTASGAYASTIERASVLTALQAWWCAPPCEGSPALILGHEGVGKTWATIDWLAKRRPELPIVLAVPSSAMARTEGVSLTGIKHMLAQRVHEVTGKRSVTHWVMRLERLLQRPGEEGPVLVLFLDGLNQQPAAPWIDILQTLQAPEFVGRVRVLVSTRKFHLEERLGSLKGLIDRPATVPVDVYDDAPGGELDQRLQREALVRADLQPPLIPYARVPRLFALVVKFKDRLVDAGKVTVHRLLWEYGRDTLGVRGGASFSEDEWRQWLAQVAQDHLQGRRRYTVKTLGELTGRADLTHADVFRRLSDLIDAPFLQKAGSGTFELSSQLVHHALGAALLTTLTEAATRDADSVARTLDTFLDPIAGLDERAEILRAAVSISLEQDPAVAQPVVDCLVLNWLTTQNVPEEHQGEINRIAASLVEPLLKVVDLAAGKQQATEQLALRALRAIDRSDGAALRTIVAYTAQWLRQIPRGVDTDASKPDSADGERSKRYRRLIGVDRDGPVTVLGVLVNMVERWAHSGTFSIGALLEGFPLSAAMPVFEAAALHQSIRGFSEVWDVVKWLVLLNPRDYHETAAALRSLSSDVLSRSAEDGVNKDLKYRAAAMLLRLTGADDDERQASAITPKDFYGPDRYALMYLNDPGASFFALEQRHAQGVLAQADVPIVRRVEKCVEFFADPAFAPPEQFINELRDHARAFDTTELHAERADPVADYFEKLEVALARCAPDELGALHRRWLAQLASRPAEARLMSASRADERFLLLDDASAAAAQALRLAFKECDEDKESSVANALLLIEVERLDAPEQFTTIIDAGTKYVLRDLGLVLKPLRSSELDALVTKYSGDEEQSTRLLYLLSLRPTGIEGAAWNWLRQFAKAGDPSVCDVAFQVLWSFDAERLGASLLEVDWRWSESSSDGVNHYGSLAVIEATRGLPFEYVAERIAPWLLLRAARLRGADPKDVQLAASIVDALLVRSSVPSPELGAKVYVFDEAQASDPFSFSVLIEPEGDTIFDRLRAMSNEKERERTRERIVATVRERVDAARKQGARLYLRSLEADDFQAVLRHSGSLVDNWLEGMDARSIDFRRRVHLADGAYLALCEALLRSDTPRGAALWRALREVLISRFKGRAGVDKMLIILMRAPDMEATTSPLASALDIVHANTDSDLLDLALAAAMSGRQDWIAATVAADRAADVPWRHQRAQQLEAMASGNDLPLPAGWAHGEMDGTTRRQSAMERSRHSEACARHWWRAFWNAATDSEAYAAWTLFVQCADRRAYSWLVNLSPCDPFETHRRRAIHAALLEPRLKWATERREKTLREEFLGRRTSGQVYPWRIAEQ